MTWLLILSLNTGMTPLIETKMFHNEETCRQYGNMKRMRDERYSYWCTNLKESTNAVQDVR